MNDSTPEAYLHRIKHEIPGTEIRYKCFRNTVFAIYLLAFFLGSYVLESVGIPYTSDGGSIVFKIHVYSLLILATVGIQGLRRGIGFFFISPVPGLGYAPLLFLLGAIWVAVYGIMKGGTAGMAYIVDTMLTPVLALFLLPCLRKEDQCRLAKMIACLIVFNSMVSIVESLGKFYLVNTTHVWIGRSSAFMAHPLNNGLILLVCFPLFIECFKGQNRLIVALVCIVGMLGFGARASTALLVLPVLLFFSREGGKFLVARSLCRKDTFLIVYFGFLISIPCLFFLVDNTGIGNRFFDSVGSGKVDVSAQTRLDVYNIFFYLTFDEWLNGATPELMLMIPDIINNEIVENFWIGWLLQFGLIGMLPMGLALLYVNSRMLIRGHFLVKISALVFFLGSYTNNSLMAKTPLLLFYFSLVSLYFLNRQKTPPDC
ncbi:VpsF family polysaccharide biosynthesis protein [Candidatus Sororendozoicomonas aggregata]|uniref:VpsF family polysaccharide biosynthesis protein n=1 Tax=Candidatus Sororendozoicomonas aggregata TaxID=3073239 RepID=UPI002ED5FB98